MLASHLDCSTAIYTAIYLSSPHHYSESFIHLKTGWAQDAWFQWSHGNWKLAGPINWTKLNIFWHYPILTLSNFSSFWHFPILTLSNLSSFWHFPIWAECDTFQSQQILTLSYLSNFWHFPILTLSNPSSFWHFPILTLSKLGGFWHFPILSFLLLLLFRERAAILIYMDISVFHILVKLSILGSQSLNQPGGCLVLTIYYSDTF